MNNKKNVKIILNENILFIFVVRIFSENNLIMPRRKRLRKIVAPPKFTGYKPYGVTGHTNGEIDLLYEEYESIKLADFDLLTHDQAAELMGVSRATFARIYESARRKIADALVNVKEIKTVYGNATFEDSWFVCSDCHSKFTMPPTVKNKNCPFCGKSSVLGIETNK